MKHNDIIKLSIGRISACKLRNLIIGLVAMQDKQLWISSRLNFLVSCLSLERGKGWQKNKKPHPSLIPHGEMKFLMMD